MESTSPTTALMPSCSTEGLASIPVEASPLFFIWLVIAGFRMPTSPGVSVLGLYNQGQLNCISVKTLEKKAIVISNITPPIAKNTQPMPRKLKVTVFAVRTFA